MKITSVILAGGGGTRFWPLSRQNMPKQLLNISGNDIMINETVKRCNGAIESKDTFIVTNKTQAEVLKDVLHNEVPRENILIEPFGRNTAPCIAYAALVIKKRYGDAVMTVLPSDHYISNEKEYQRILNKAFDLAVNTDKLITIGIKPTFPSTGYGYINFNEEKYENNIDTYEVKEFVEKPNFSKAKEYVDSGSYLWNSGMFLWRASVILENFKRYLPRMYNQMEEIYDFIDTDKEHEVLTRVYENVKGISVDYGIMERSDDVLVIPGDFGWNDVGSWDALGAIFDNDDNGNIIKANHLGIDTKNSIIHSNDRLITTIGVDNLINADTKDALLICPKDRAQEVKDMVDLLKSRDMKEYI